MAKTKQDDGRVNIPDQCWPALNYSTCPVYTPMVFFTDWVAQLALLQSTGHYEKGRGIRGPGGEVIYSWFDESGSPPKFVTSNVKIMADIIAGVMTWEEVPQCPVWVRVDSKTGKWEWRRVAEAMQK